MVNKWVVQYTVEYDSPDNIEDDIARINGMGHLTLKAVGVVYDQKFTEP